MRTLALSDDILLNIEKPARYIGGEVNSVMKDKSEVDIRFAMCFPDVYEIGMSHLGIQILQPQGGCVVRTCVFPVDGFGQGDAGTAYPAFRTGISGSDQNI